jgi:hypothetical protein
VSFIAWIQGLWAAAETCRKISLLQVSSKAFATPHSRYGTLSWAIQENDDDKYLQQRDEYISTEFLITTGWNP